MNKALPVPAIGTLIQLNSASVQMLRSGDFGVRIRYNAGAASWQMLDSPQHGGKLGGLLVLLDNPEMLTNGSKPSHVEVLRLLPNATGAFGRLLNTAHDANESKTPSGQARALPDTRMSADALLQAAYDREQETRRHAETFGANQGYRQPAGRRPGAGNAGSFRKKVAARAT